MRDKAQCSRHESTDIFIEYNVFFNKSKSFFVIYSEIICIFLLIFSGITMWIRGWHLVAKNAVVQRHTKVSMGKSIQIGVSSVSLYGRVCNATCGATSSKPHGKIVTPFQRVSPHALSHYYRPISMSENGEIYF
ncbi:MAG: hypothetical protein IJ191_08640 [Treponema sp.]|nr:hypothetical protein [Treponema sp.]